LAMKRREFISLLGGAATWPLAAHAQQPERMWRVGALSGTGGDDPASQERLSVFLQEMNKLGWTVGRNLRLEERWGAGNVEHLRKQAMELIALAPDAILASGTVAMPPLLQATRTVPIVFINVADPVGAGFINSLARPGGNVTGFMQFEYSLSGKWLELLKEIAPNIKRVAVIRDQNTSSGIGQFAVIQAFAPALGIDVSPINARDVEAVQSAIADFARLPNGGLVVTAAAFTVIHRVLIARLAAQHRLPAVYPRKVYAADGGLISYGFDVNVQVRLAAGYVDRILRGEKPSDMPAQAPTKYDLTINLKAAKALGLAIPPTVLARADEVIE
jgi:putative ABC transport system substrate-binding protein